MKCDPVLGGIYEYCRTSKHRTVWNKDESQRISDMKTYEFEFHKKRSFLSEILQTTDMTLMNIQKYGSEYGNPGLWFSPKYCVKTWSDWILDLPRVVNIQSYRNRYYQDDTESNGFHRNEWHTDTQMVSNRFYGNQNTGNNRWELMEHVHFFTQKIFHQWKWNVRCAAFHGEKEAVLAVIPLYHDHLIPFLFGSLLDGTSVLHSYGLESVFHRVIRSLRREQFGLILRAGAHEMVIRYSDIRVREERGSTWDNLIQEFLGLLREQLPNRRIDDQKVIWENSAPGRIPGIVLEWWVSWGEFWTHSAQTPVSWIQSQEEKTDDDWEKEVMEEEEEDFAENE